MADLFVLLVAAAVIWYFGGFVRSYRDRRAEMRFRRQTLWFDPEAELYRWQTRDGRHHSAPDNPDQPGGLWYEADLEAMEQMRS